MKQSDSNLLKRSGAAVADTAVDSVDALISTSTGVPIPALRLAWELSKSLLGKAVEFRKQRALEWVQAIIDDPATFSEQVVSSQEFQDGFVVALEDYLKLRDYMKRRMALKAFSEFANSNDKVEFPLERYNDTLRKVSPASLKTLAFVKNEVLPVMEQRVAMEEQSGVGYAKASPDPRPFSRYDQTGTLNTMGDQLAELEYLGLVKQVSSYPTGFAFSSDGMITGWALTNFANEFIRFIEEDAQLTNNSILPIPDIDGATD